MVVPDGVNSQTLRRSDLPFQIVADHPGLVRLDAEGCECMAVGLLLGLAEAVLALDLERGARVALVADTSPDFVRFFFACQYAGMTPVPLPAKIQLGGHREYTGQLERLLSICQASVAIAGDGFLPFLEEAAGGLDLRFAGSPQAFAALPASTAPMENVGWLWGL